MSSISTCVMEGDGGLAGLDLSDLNASLDPINASADCDVYLSLEEALELGISVESPGVLDEIPVTEPVPGPLSQTSLSATPTGTPTATPIPPFLSGSGTASQGHYASYRFAPLQQSGAEADTIGVFRPSSALWYLKNANDATAADLSFGYGNVGDYPVVGDWDGNGTVTVGVYHDGTFYLRNSNTEGFGEIAFPFGQPGDQPIAGDWDGDGIIRLGSITVQQMPSSYAIATAKDWQITDFRLAS